MVIKTRFTELLGCKHPIVLAGMGPFTTYKTAVLVSNAGGVGLTSHWGIASPVNPETFQIDRENGVLFSSVQKLKYDLKYIEENLEDDKRIGCNVRVARMSVDAPRVIRTIVKEREKSKKLKECLRLVVTSAGSPVPPNQIINNPKYYKDGKPDLLHFHVSPSLALCKVTIERAGCDGVVAVGYEGGGHQSYEGVCTSVLVPEVRDTYPDIPIVAGGGFYDGKTVVSALSLGADAVQMGSRFIATSDGEFHENFKQALIKGMDNHTQISAGGFGPIRILKNLYAQEHSKVLTKEEKIHQEKSWGKDQALSEQLRKDLRAYELTYEGDVEHGAVLCGQTICGIHDLPTVRELVDRIMQEAEHRINHLTILVD